MRIVITKKKKKSLFLYKIETILTIIIYFRTNFIKTKFFIGLFLDLWIRF